MSNPNPFQKNETPKPTVPQSEVRSETSEKPHILVSNTDAYIWDRMKAQPKSIEDISIQVMEKAEPNVHRLSLPKELDPYKKDYAFKWIFKSKRAIDEACDLKGWNLVKRNYFSDLPDYLFTVNGAIERGDNILGVMSRKRAEAMRRIPLEKAKVIIDSTIGRHKDNPEFYVPKDEDTGDRIVGI